MLLTIELKSTLTSPALWHTLTNAYWLSIYIRVLGPFDRVVAEMPVL
jgi:hypothetical protein